MDEKNLMQLVEQTTFNVASVSKQMGLLASAVTNLKVDQKRLEDKVNTQCSEFKQFVEKYNENERIDADDQQEYVDAIKGRVSEILKSRGRRDLFGEFSKQCWNNAKTHSRMRGKGGFQTKKMYHREVVDYINAWEPYSYGTDGYIRHLDDLKKNKRRGALT